jgi:hypothetical protein
MRKFFLILLFCAFSQFSASPQAIDFGSIPKSGTILVYAHQDDDLIWMHPFWNITEKFICGAMPTTPRLKEIVHNQQLYMNSNGYQIDFESNWIHPWGEITNNEYQSYYWNRYPEYTYIGNDHVLNAWYDYETEKATKEINKIKAKIEQYIANPGVSRIITHNNWGEYGHNQHRAVNKAVRELAVKYRKDVWMLGCDNGYFGDITVPPGITYTLGTFDGNLFDAIREIYLHPNNWWTWSTTDTPSGNHEFVKIVDAGSDKSNILKGDVITVPGPPQYAPGAYIFDGNDDYMTLEGNNNVTFSIGMWVRPDEIKVMDIAKMTEYPLSGYYDRCFNMESDGRISVRISNGQNGIVTSSTALSVGKWYHILMTSDGNLLKLYINDTYEGSNNSGSAASTYYSPEFVLGQAQLTSSFFKGQIADVKMYDYVLSENEIHSLFGTPKTAYGINYFSETTDKTVPETDEYAYQADMSNAVAGNGEKIRIIPGQDVYFRLINSYNLLTPEIQHLVVPARPVAPDVSVDYQSETTSQNIDSTMEYSFSALFSNHVAGNGNKVAILPGQNLYFRIRATASIFASVVDTLMVPGRPQSPVFTINYTERTTNEVAGENIAYTYKADFSDASFGEGKPVVLEPLNTLYFRKIADYASFKSEISQLKIPDRNFLGYSGPDTITEEKFRMYAMLIDLSYTFDLSDLLVINGTAGNLKAGNVFDIYPDTRGPVSVMIRPNSIADSTFASNEVVVYFNRTITGITDESLDNFSVYPNPSKDGIIYLSTRLNKPFSVNLYTSNGSFVRILHITDPSEGQVNLQELSPGNYFLRFLIGEKTYIYKIVLQ